MKKFGIGLLSSLLILISCNKEKSFPEKLDGCWSLDEIETIEIEGEKIKAQQLAGEDVIRIQFNPATSTFNSFISWTSDWSSNEYSEGNGGTYQLSGNKLIFNYDLELEEIVETEIEKLSNKKLHLKIVEYNLSTEQNETNIYKYKSVDWTP